DQTATGTGGGFGTQNRCSDETARTSHDPDPPKIALVGVEQASRNEFAKICGAREDRSVVLFGTTSRQLRQINHLNSTHEVSYLVPKKQGFGKTNCQREIGYHSVRIDALFAKTGRKIDRIKSGISLQTQRVH